MCILQGHGIAIPKNFTPEKISYMYPNYHDHSLFVKAFEEYFYPHGLMQKGFYWLNKEDYKKGQASCESTRNIANEIIKLYNSNKK